LQAVSDGASLLAGPAMGLLDNDRLPGLGLPILDEGRVEVLVELAGRIVGDVQQGRIGEHGARREGCKDKDRAGGKGASKSGHLSISSTYTLNST
jgi:hypothetical protein